MKLSGEQRQRLQLALLDAFPSKSSLEQMLSFGLNKNLNTLASEGNLQDIVFQTIQAAEAKGWIKDLVYAARRANSGNTSLKIIASELLSHQDISESLYIVTNPNQQEVADKIDYIVPAQPSVFITGAPVTQPYQFFGREKELKRLFGLLKKHPLQNAAIIGKKRIGKTSLLHYLKNVTTTPVEQLRKGQKSDWLPNPKNYKWIFVDFQDHRMATREKLMSYILSCMGFKSPENCSLCNFMDIVSDNLQNPTVILLDEVGVGLQRCPELDDEFWESLRSLATNHTKGNLGFILATHSSPTELAHSTGHSSPFFNIFGYTAMLEAFTENEARSLIASSPIPFPEEDLQWILEQSRRLPLLLQILCRLNNKVLFFHL